MEIKTNENNVVITLTKDEFQSIYDQCKKDERYFDNDYVFGSNMINFIKTVEKEMPEMKW